MVSNDMGFSNPSDDWSVILQSYSPKLKKELVRRITEIFELEKKDAEQALANTPLILLDNLSFGMAARIKNFFQKLGAVVETTNHEMIKKNCFQVLWPETPDLSFFLKEETKPAAKEAVQETPSKTFKEPRLPEVLPSEIPEKEAARGVIFRASQPAPAEPEATPSVKDADGWEKLMKDPEPPRTPKTDDGWEKLAKGPVLPQAPKADDAWETLDKGPALPHAPKADDGWEKRAKELSKKLESFQEEKKKVNEDVVLKAVEKVKNDFGRLKETEKPKRDETAPVTPDSVPTRAPEAALDPENADWRSKALLLSDRVRDLENDLADSKEALVKEVEMWRSKTASAEGRARDLEADLAQKSQEVERIAREKEELGHQEGRAKDLELQLETLRQGLTEKTNLAAEKENSLAELQDQVKEWTGKAQERERALEEKENSLASLRDQLKDWTDKAQAAENTLSERDSALRAVQNELETLREREKELLQKADSLQGTVKAMGEDLLDRDESLKARDEALAAFERQIAEFATTIRELEPIRQEHAQLSHERGTIRKEYETKIADLEVRSAKIEDDNRRYRSRTDRKVAAATRELGEWVRGVEALRQGLQKLVVFLGSEAAAPDPEKKSLFRSPLNRTTNSNGTGKS